MHMKCRSIWCMVVVLAGTILAGTAEASKDLKLNMRHNLQERVIKFRMGDGFYEVSDFPGNWPGYSAAIKAFQSRSSFTFGHAQDSWQHGVLWDRISPWDHAEPWKNHGSWSSRDHPWLPGHYRLTECLTQPWDGHHVPVVPEPETYAMLLGGLGLLGFVTRRRKTLIE